ncbi:MAG: DEAD/DEAH box helicase family protein [Candidatus Taylorbacteria bacterium]|nr:DEAD/DEAH box helicase family protein [Candidatus Taylorbacteria bacterium]
METNIKLVDEFNILSKQGIINKEIPSFVLQNLNPKYAVREYQKEALARFQYYLDTYKGKKLPVQLLFHMATGSGKTLLMASDILYLYGMGYRNFIFFVNSTNIIKKTQSNFLDKGSSKYLFGEKIVFKDKEVEVKEVENFEAVNSDNINILFTTIQGLHSRLTSPQENSITYEDFKGLRIAFLSDEAHHINTLTKSKLDKEELEEATSWERTVNRILSSNQQNIMLEYTATIELSHPAVARKYTDKIIYQYTLANFREDGYSKDVELLQSDLDSKDRALQAVVLSQYRRKVAEKNKIQLKPVILFKSKQIKDSEEFEAKFYEMIRNLKVADIKKIEASNQTGILKQVFDFFAVNKITTGNLVKEIQEDFSKEKCLIINSKADSEEKQIKVNTLEDYVNETRAIFTTNMLNEGWDVLNLFDIVRLYETRDAKAGKAGSTTISEAQLIGRGARYYPFQVDQQQEKDKRKYDSDLDNELRVLEELHYHSISDSRYIAELHNELVNIGITPSNREIKTVSIKPDIQKTKFWSDGLIFLNKAEKKDYSNIKSLQDIIKNTLFKYKLKTGGSIEYGIFEEQESAQSVELRKKTIKLNSIEKHVLRKALDKVSFYHFDNMAGYFPNLKSIDEFMTSDDYAGFVDIEIYAKNGRLDDLNNIDEFYIALDVLKELAGKIQSSNTEFIGAKEFLGQKVQVIAQTKTLEILRGGDDKEYGVAMNETHNDDLRLDLSTQDWYMYNENYGTSEEKYLIQFIKYAISDLKKKYQDVYLLRNERLFKIYRFSDGKAIEPDFVLFLKEKGKKVTISYQLFIEPKGNRGLIEDKWKEEFLKEIESEFKIETLFEKGKFKLVGLPFYNEQQTKQEFDKTFRQKLAI